MLMSFDKNCRTSSLCEALASTSFTGFDCPFYCPVQSPHSAEATHLQHTPLVFLYYSMVWASIHLWFSTHPSLLPRGPDQWAIKEGLTSDQKHVLFTALQAAPYPQNAAANQMSALRHAKSMYPNGGGQRRTCIPRSSAGQRYQQRELMTSSHPVHDESITGAQWYADYDLELAGSRARNELGRGARIE